MRRPHPTQHAFTLMEVMIAMAIFFVAIAAVLQLMSLGLRMARSIQLETPSPAIIAAEISQLASTNALMDGWSDAGDFSFLSEELYEGFRWDAEAYEISSNGLFQADIVVRGERGDQTIERHMSVYLFNPNPAEGAVPGIR